MARYGADNPDVRFGLEMTDISPILKKTEFKAFAEVLQRGGIVKAIQVDKDLSRKDLDNLHEFARGLGAKGLNWIKVSPEGWPQVSGPLAKFLSEEEKAGLGKSMNPAPGNILLFMGDSAKVVNDVLEG